jgi:hypothetical protein
VVLQGRVNLPLLGAHWNTAQPKPAAQIAPA